MGKDEAKQYKVIKAARDHHNRTCSLGPAIEVHMSPYDVARLGWEEGEMIAGLMLVVNEAVQPDRLRVLCAGDKELNPPKRPAERALPQPKVIEIPHYSEEITIDPERALTHAEEWPDAA